jgi:hypothetical protein
MPNIPNQYHTPEIRATKPSNVNKTPKKPYNPDQTENPQPYPVNPKQKDIS